MPKLTNDQRAAIRQDGRPTAVIAAEYGVTERTIRRVRAAQLMPTNANRSSRKSGKTDTKRTQTTCPPARCGETDADGNPQWCARHQQYLQHRRNGALQKDAAAQAMLDETAISHKIHDNAAFGAADAAANAEFANLAAASIGNAFPKDWKAGAWWLSRQRRQDYAPPDKQQPAAADNTLDGNRIIAQFPGDADLLQETTWQPAETNAPDAGAATLPDESPSPPEERRRRRRRLKSR